MSAPCIHTATRPAHLQQLKSAHMHSKLLPNHACKLGVMMMVAACLQTLQEGPPLASMGPQAIAPLSCASITDPDTLAVVTTRNDLVMIIDYVTGDRLVQDSDGTRVTTYASGGFMVESSGLPLVKGGPSGISLEPMPGIVTGLA